MQDHWRQGRSKLASVIPLPSPSSHRNKAGNAGKFAKHTKAPEKNKTPLIRNGKIPRAPPLIQHNSKSNAHSHQVLVSENGKAPKQRKQVTPTPSVPEACSLLEHNQEKVVASKLRHSHRDQDQLSDSSHESTQTAIFCEDNLAAPPPNAAPERPLHIQENQRTRVSIHQLNNEVKQYFQNKEAAQQAKIEEGSSRTLDYINLDHCTGDVSGPEDVSDQQQNYNHHQAHPALVNEELFSSDDTTTSSEYQISTSTRTPHIPLPPEGLQPVADIIQESQVTHQHQEIQNVPTSPPKNNPLSLPVPSDHWPPATSPSHITQHKIHSASPTRVRMAHQPPDPPTRARQQRAVSQSPIPRRQGDGAPGSPPRVGHYRTPSESPVRVPHHMGQESPVRASHHMQESPVRGQHTVPSESLVNPSHPMSRASPVRVTHHVNPESPEIKRRQYRAPSESPVRSLRHSTESPITARITMRRNSESPHRVAEHEGILRSPSREMSDFAPSQSAARPRQQQGESPTKDVLHQRHLESPVRYREYHKAPPESLFGRQIHHLPPTPTRPHQNQITNTPRRAVTAQPSLELLDGHQSNPPHKGFPHAPQRQQQQQQSQGHVILSRRSQTPSPTLHNALARKSSKNTLLSNRSSVPDLSSSVPHTTAHQATLSPGQLNASSINPLPPNVGRHNLPPTPPRSKKPRQLPSFPPAHPTLVQPRLQTNASPHQLSPEEITTSFVVPESQQMEGKEQALTHIPPPAATPAMSVGEVRGHESRKRFREVVKASGSPSTVRRQVAIQTDKYQMEQSTQSISSMAQHFASVSSPVATSSPLTHRRRARFPDDFLWQGSSGKM